MIRRAGFGSLVFTPPEGPISRQPLYSWWVMFPGANWRHPKGHSTIQGRENHFRRPHLLVRCRGVCQVGFGKRLPTEANGIQPGGLEKALYVGTLT